MAERKQRELDPERFADFGTHGTTLGRTTFGSPDRGRRSVSSSPSWATVADTSYGYDNSGDVTSISDAVTSDTQCLNYDYDQHLTAAWAQTATTCPAKPPGASGIGGPAPYLQKLTYDPAGTGNVTENDLTTPATTATTTLTYPRPGQTQPHTPSTITTTTNGTTTTTSNPAYNLAGQLHTTGTGPTAQTLTWNDPGQLTTTTDASGDATAYRYDANGTLLLRQDNNATTLYLPGEEITATGTTKTATRYYTLAGQTIAARTPTSLNWLIADPHSTDTLAIDATSGTPATDLSHRYYTPFGAPRGTPPSTWPGDHGFIGGTTDTTTGWTNLGAREYNPTTPAFLSPDPLLTPYTPQDLNPYTYALANPATNTDPTGTLIRPGPDGSCSPGASDCNGGGGDSDPTSNQTGPGNNGSNSNGGGCGFLWLGCASNIASDIAGGAANGITHIVVTPVIHLGSSLVQGWANICPPVQPACAGASVGGAEIGARINNVANFRIPLGDPNSLIYKVAYWTAPLLLPAGGEAAEAAGAAAEASVEVPTAQSLASDVAEQTGGALKTLKSGYSVTVPQGSRGIVVRVMEEGGGNTNYYRISVPGLQTYTVTGEVSTDPALTHIPITNTSLHDILNVISQIGQ